MCVGAVVAAGQNRDGLVPSANLRCEARRVPVVIPRVVGVMVAWILVADRMGVSMHDVGFRLLDLHSP